MRILIAYICARFRNHLAYLQLSPLVDSSEPFSIPYIRGLFRQAKYFSLHNVISDCIGGVDVFRNWRYFCKVTVTEIRNVFFSSVLVVFIVWLMDSFFVVRVSFLLWQIASPSGICDQNYFPNILMKSKGISRLVINLKLEH